MVHSRSWERLGLSRDNAISPRERYSALIEIMLLAAVADGKVSDREMETLLRRVLERPEFEGTLSLIHI